MGKAVSIRFNGPEYQMIKKITGAFLLTNVNAVGAALHGWSMLTPEQRAQAIQWQAASHALKRQPEAIPT